MGDVRYRYSDRTMEELLQIWKMVSGAEGLEPTTALESFADSLMAMLVSGMIKKRLGKDITVESLKRCESIEDQARLVDQTQSIEAAGLPSSSTRDGPPDVLDLAHAEGKQEVHARTKARVTEALEKLDLGLNWDDVEDVIPFPDAGVTFVHRLRNVSWNLRFVYSAPCDSQQLEAAVKRSLENHPTLRSMTIEFDGKVFIVPIRTSKKWWNASLTTGHELDTPDGLRTLLLDDPVLDAAAAPGPLTRMHIASIRDGTSGIVLVASHSVNDQSSMRLWMEDIAIGIKSLSAPLPPRVAFRDFAALYYQHRQGAEAKHGVQYWARKLHGISSLPDTTFWPNQRAPEFMKGIDPEWRHWNGSLSRTGERSVSFVEKRKAQKGLRRMAKIQDISRLKSVHNIPSFMLVKAAMAMMMSSSRAEKKLSGAPSTLLAHGLSNPITPMTSLQEIRWISLEPR